MKRSLKHYGACAAALALALTTAQAQENTATARSAESWQAAIERAGGEAAYRKHQPEFNRLKTAFFRTPTPETKKALLDYITRNKLFWPKPMLPEGGLESAVKEGQKSVTVYQAAITDSTEISAELDRWIKNKTQPR